MVIFPLAVKVRVPLVETSVPDVPILAEAPVVVTEKLPPTVDVPRVTAPVFVIKAVLVPPVLTVRLEAAVVIGVPETPILPVAAKLRVPEVDVIKPELLMLAEAPVVVIEKLPPTVEVPMLTLPALET